MAGDTRLFALGDCVRFVSGGTPSKSRPDYWGGDVPWVTAKDMKTFWINDSEDQLTVEGADAATWLAPPRSTLMLVRGMTLHNNIPIVRVRRDSAFNQDVKAVIPAGPATQEFIPYLLLAHKSDLLNRVDSAGHGTGRLSMEVLSTLLVWLPGPSEQETIARLLSTLDDKIELNRRMAKTLEAMARALFKSWFVDFDPVRAKAEGRPTGLPNDLAALFPARFVPAALGPIPEGWDASTIAELARIVGGSTPSTTNPAFWQDGQHCWATPKDLSGLAAPVLLETERKITDAGVAQISSGLLPPGTVLLSSRAPIGYLAIAQIPVAINQGFIAMLPKTWVPQPFLVLWADWAHDEIVSRANGSTFLEISKANFRPIPIVRPPAPIFGAFDELASPLFARVVFNEHESRTLTALRDALLPKLISGEIRVRDAEALAEGTLAASG